MTERPRPHEGVSRHGIATSVSFGNYEGRPIPVNLGGDRHHISGEVEIEISGAAKDRPYTYELLEEIEQAVIETVDDFDGGEA